MYRPGKSKWFLSAALFALCAAPTFISYQPYLFSWDDSGYLKQSMLVSRAFWSWNTYGLRAMTGSRPPAMALLAMPWGPLESWDSVGKCFITLDTVIALLAATCLYLLLRIGVKPLLLAAAGICVFASLGPFPYRPSAYGPYTAEASAHWGSTGFLSAHWAATAFMGDALFAWTTLAALLFIPYEARTPGKSIKGAVLRGILWGAVLSLGIMTKANFIYFIALIVPALLFIKRRNEGPACAIAALIALLFCSAPCAAYYYGFGKPILALLLLAPSGHGTEFFYTPILQFVIGSLSESPGLILPLLLTVPVGIYLLKRGPKTLLEPDLFTLLISIGFGLIVLTSTNKQIRYAFPAIVALPFLTAILMSGPSGKEHTATPRYAALIAVLVFCGFFTASLPVRHRAVRQSLSRSDIVLSHAEACSATDIVVATDSPTLNGYLLDLAAGDRKSPIKINSVVYQASWGLLLKDDLPIISASDQIIFQDNNTLFPAFSNQRVSDYERYVLQAGYVPEKIGTDILVYSRHCHPPR